MNEFSGAKAAFLALEPLDLRFDDAQRRVFGILGFGRAEVRTQVEQIVLDRSQHRVDRARRMQARQADAGIGLVDRAVGGHAVVELVDAFAVAQRRLARVAAFGVDARQPNHGFF
jgi:hypothetical protein